MSFRYWKSNKKVDANENKKNAVGKVRQNFKMP